MIGFIGVSIFPYLKNYLNVYCNLFHRYFTLTCGIGMLFLMLYIPPNVWGFTFAIISSRCVCVFFLFVCLFVCLFVLESIVCFN